MLFFRNLKIGLESNQEMNDSIKMGNKGGVEIVYMGSYTMQTTRPIPFRQARAIVPIHPSGTHIVIPGLGGCLLG